MTRSSTSAEFIRCPQCLSRVATDTPRCECGYVLAAVRDRQPAGEDLLGKAERLYDTYLSARTLRARKTVIDLRARRMRNLRDENLGRQLRAAEKELRALELQSMAQNAEKDDSAREPDGPLASNDSEIITEVIETSDEMEDTVTLSSDPTEDFRRSQAERAASAPRPGQANDFTAAQARRAEAAVAASDESRHKVCPKCEATLSPAAQQCICGYSFRPIKRRRPFLSDEEERALRNR